MGMVMIRIGGSFGNKPAVSFSAEEGGHALAIARGIEYLQAELETAIQLDHQLHDDGQRPPKSDFGKRPPSS
jgi:hypothetical protein